MMKLYTRSTYFQDIIITHAHFFSSILIALHQTETFIQMRLYDAVFQRRLKLNICEVHPSRDNIGLEKYMSSRRMGFRDYKRMDHKRTATL